MFLMLELGARNASQPRPTFFLTADRGRGPGLVRSIENGKGNCKVLELELDDKRD